MTDDQTLGDTTPNDGDTVFGNPNARTPEQRSPMRMLTVEEVLAAARLPEKRARICLRADLQAEHDDLVAELATYVNAAGELLEDEGERAVGDSSVHDRVVELNDKLGDVRRRMAESMWFPLFRGLSTDALSVFNKQHFPKGDNPDLVDYNIKLVAECSVSPKMTVDDVKALRQHLGSKAIGTMITTVHEVCTRGGVDVPKLPAALLNLTQQ